MNTMMTNINFVLACLSIIFSLIAAIFAFFAYSTCVGLKNSTHQIEYRSMSTTGEESPDEFAENLKKIMDDEDEENV